MKKPQSVLEYPVVIRKVLDQLTISAPDLSLWTSIPAPQRKFEDGAMKSIMNDEYALDLGRAIIKAWRQVDSHISEKKWVPEASTFRKSVVTETGDLSLPEFTRLVQKQVSVSQDTVRRAVDRGTIKAYKTTGGHRRIPYSSLPEYLDFLARNAAILTR